jgi:hypothetical protein
MLEPSGAGAALRQAFFHQKLVEISRFDLFSFLRFVL